jgi:hypothetical protein
LIMITSTGKVDDVLGKSLCEDLRVVIHVEEDPFGEGLDGFF